MLFTYTVTKLLKHKSGSSTLLHPTCFHRTQVQIDYLTIKLEFIELEYYVNLTPSLSQFLISLSLTLNLPLALNLPLTLSLSLSISLSHSSSLSQFLISLTHSLPITICKTKICIFLLLVFVLGMEEAHTTSIIVLTCHESLTESCLQVLIFDISQILDLPHIFGQYISK